MYRINDEIATKLSDIARLREKITAASLLPTREAALRRKAVVKIAYTSTSIEGNELKEDQVQALVEGREVNAHMRQIQEVENYLSALDHIDHLSQSNQLRSSDILNIHERDVGELVSKDKTGKWRKGPVYIVEISDSNRNRVVYTAPPAEQVPGLVHEMLEW